MRRRAGIAAALLAVAAGVGAGLARGEQAQQGNLIVSLDGGISPRKLPRHELAPVAVQIAGAVRTADGSPLPRLRQVEVAIGGSGRLDTRGLGICRRSQLVDDSPEAALETCGDALVGAGRLDVEILIEGQAPFELHASLRAFNGPRPHGHRVIWLHVFAPRPPLSFVLPFVVHRRRGAFPTSLVARVPAGLGPWPHLARFEMTLGRRFSYRDRPQSFLTAKCPLPPRYSASIFPFARATYEFADGRKLSTTITRGCRVRQVAP